MLAGGGAGATAVAVNHSARAFRPDLLHCVSWDLGCRVFRLHALLVLVPHGPCPDLLQICWVNVPPFSAWFRRPFPNSLGDFLHVVFGLVRQAGQSILCGGGLGGNG